VTGGEHPAHPGDAGLVVEAADAALRPGRGRGCAAWRRCAGPSCQAVGPRTAPVRRGWTGAPADQGRHQPSVSRSYQRRHLGQVEMRPRLGTGPVVPVTAGLSGPAEARPGLPGAPRAGACVLCELRTSDPVRPARAALAVSDRPDDGDDLRMALLVINHDLLSTAVAPAGPRSGAHLWGSTASWPASHESEAK
jgi:hypothetical protein